MRIRHKLILLLGIPLVFQTAFTAWLGYSHAQLDSLVAQETRAKSVLALVGQMREKVEQTFMRLSLIQFLGRDEFPNSGQQGSLKECFATMKNLTHDNKDAQQILSRTESECRLLISTWQEFISPGAQILDASAHDKHVTFADKMLSRFRAVNKSADELVAIYSPIAKELRPRESKAREDLRRFIFGSMVFNVLLVIAMASVINRNTISRLNVLMKHIAMFRDGRVPTESLTGTDELVELDKAFSTMAAEKSSLEEIRRSLRAMVSHDLRSPLTSMGIRLEMLLAKGSEPDLSARVEKSLRQLLVETHRLQRLSNTLLDVERMQDGKLDLKLERVSIETIVATSIEALQGQVSKKGITLQAQVLTPNLTCVCDADRTIQILINLLSNAIKFTESASSVTLIAKQTDSGGALFEVVDQGPGIPEDQVCKLFSKFSQLDQPEEVKVTGSGLGLYVCKMLVAAHEGAIGYRNGPNGGSCFWFELPGRT